MARYIDADKFKSNIEKAMEKMHLIVGVKGVDVCAVIKALDMQPTADVVPKSEVAREIFEKIEEECVVKWGNSRLFNEDAFYELKKKYTEG